MKSAYNPYDHSEAGRAEKARAKVRAKAGLMALANKARAKARAKDKARTENVDEPVVELLVDPTQTLELALRALVAKVSGKKRR